MSQTSACFRGRTAAKGRRCGGSKSPLATENLLENTAGVLHHRSLGAAPCCLLFMLTRAILMPSLFRQRWVSGHLGLTKADTFAFGDGTVRLFRLFRLRKQLHVHVENALEDPLGLSRGCSQFWLTCGRLVTSSHSKARMILR